MRVYPVIPVVIVVLKVLLVPSNGQGPFAVNTGRYRYTAKRDNLVLSDRKTEIWAEVYYPRNIALTVGKLPLVVFLHGNHATCGRVLSDGTRSDSSCQYTSSGTCPSGFVVAPSHEGYRYVGIPLASYGYVVVSINANRGITCGGGVSEDGGLNLARGRLVLRHLALWSKWNRLGGAPGTLGFDPKRKINFQQVGLMGHSRGGEGMRAALTQYRDAGTPWKRLIGRMLIRAVFEIGPVDGQTSRTLNAYGVASMILLPSCDGDVSDLQGMHVFDRQFLNIGSRPYLPKGTILVNGAIHNYYNTEWQEPDSTSCGGTQQLPSAKGKSVPQQNTLKGTLLPFIRAYVGPGNERFGVRFDPSYPIPSFLRSVSFYARNHLRAPLQIGGEIEAVESFSRATGKSNGGLNNIASNVVVRHASAHYEHDSSVRVAQVSWTGSGSGKYFQIALGTTSSPFLDFSNYQTLSFRVAVYCSGQICSSNINNSPDMDFHIRLVQGTRLSTAIQLSDLATVRRPVDGHSVLETIDLPVALFTGVNLSHITGLRFVFDVTSTGRIDLAHVFRDVEGPRALSFPLTTSRASLQEGPPLVGSPFSRTAKNIIPATSNTFAGARQRGRGVELMFNSSIEFLVTNSFPRLKVGGVTSTDVRLSPDLRSIAFTLSERENAALDPQADAVIEIGKENVW
eukprot:CAMPEP_0184682868 /NCGR_PEP_ID=MMETSP0312-20130426/9042_1 /TAXON_ID=31354 /ORGANISM="Compsopogon coeruleus, Strain SAG 36.94" /LENGTH=679 /DNA_ID=CAMNT_0027134819 /DNA_START=355 /DNA_END=2391 /DNA_ORIENTATION=+